MAERHESSPVTAVIYDRQADILTFAFTEQPQPAVAEEAADDVWVRHDPDTHQVISVDILNFSAQVEQVFGPNLTYSERTDPQRIENLHGLLLPPKA
jgi:uncharacterized protein YuzE